MLFRSQCPISSALDIVGDRWSLLIIRDIAFSQKRTFGEFSASEEGIASNILADRLSKLEHLGILARGYAPENRKTVLYTLTPKGADLIPVLAEYILWSEKYLHDHISQQARQFAAMLKTKKASVLTGVRSRVLGRE